MKLNVKKADGCDDLPLPKVHSEHAAGVDLHAAEDYILAPGTHKLISAGIHVEIPDGHFGMVTPRSGLAAKHRISIVNSPGVIDADYRGLVRINLINLGREPFDVRRGDRIAQLIVVPYPSVTIKEVADLTETARGRGGFGSTGK